MVAAAEPAVDTVAQLLKRIPEPAWMRMDSTSILFTCEDFLTAQLRTRFPTFSNPLKPLQFELFSIGRKISEYKDKNCVQRKPSSW